MIITKYSGPTDTTGSRIVATATINNKRRQKTVPYNYALDPQDNHLAALLALLRANGFGTVRLADIGQVWCKSGPKGYGWEVWMQAGRLLIP